MRKWYNVETWENSKYFPKFPNRQGKNLSNICELGGIWYEKMDFMYDFVNCWFKY